MVDGISAPENIHGAQEDDILLPEAGVKEVPSKKETDLKTFILRNGFISYDDFFPFCITECKRDTYTKTLSTGINEQLIKLRESLKKTIPYGNESTSFMGPGCFFERLTQSLSQR